MSDVKASVALTSDGRLQGFIGGSATNLGPLRIHSIQCQSSAADGEVKIYHETGSATAKNLVFHGKFGTAANEVQEFKLPGAGIYCDSGAYVDLTNCDFCYVVGTF